MWQRFTERSRRVVFLAQDEATKLGDHQVSPEHLLLALCRETDTVAARLLEKMSITPVAIRERVMETITSGPGRRGAELELSPRAKRVVDLAFDEARRIGNNYIGTEHLLLGLIGEADGETSGENGRGRAGRVLAELGADRERTRREVAALQDPEKEESGMVAEAIERTRAMLTGRRRAAAPREAMAKIEADYGDLGTVKAPENRTHVEIAFDAAAFLALVNIFRARDAHGYRAMSHGDQTMFLAPNGTPVKLLVPPAATDPAALEQGIYVRVLGGDYEGYAGWMFADAFSRSGPDEAPFPPEPEI